MSYSWATESWRLSTDEPQGDGVTPEGSFVAYLSINQVPEVGGVGLVLEHPDGEYHFTVRQSTMIEHEDETSFMASHFPVTLRADYSLIDMSLALYFSYNEQEWSKVSDEIWIPLPTTVAPVLRYDTYDQPANAIVSYFRLHPWPYANDITTLDAKLPMAPPVSHPVQRGRAAARRTFDSPATVNVEPVVHGIVGAQFGDMEFDIGKSARWLDWFVDDMFITDINTGNQRYWVVNWTESFPKAQHVVTGTNWFVEPAQFRQEQFEHADKAFGYHDADWVIFIDGHEGFSVDNRTLPNDYTVAPFQSFIWREITRAQTLGQTSAVLPYYIFLRSDEIQNITYPTSTVAVTDPDDPMYVPPVSQAVSVPYYLPYQGLRRLWQVSALRAPGFDWSRLDTPEAYSSTVKAQIISYGYAHWSLQDITPPDTVVPPTTAENDQGWIMRNLMEMVRPVLELPNDDGWTMRQLLEMSMLNDPGMVAPNRPWISPQFDPEGFPGPWCGATTSVTDPTFEATIEEDVGHSDPHASMEGLRVPLYDTVFRLNMRDGLWYQYGVSGNIPLRWVDDHWEPTFNPTEWAAYGVAAGTNQVTPP